MVVAFRPAILDRHVLALDQAGFVEAFAKTATNGAQEAGDALLRNPTTGIADCCARAVIGHAANPPRYVMNSRRLIWGPRLWSNILEA